MVTLPSEAAVDCPLVRALVQAGTDCFRINCAHDSTEQWSAMVANIRRAAREAHPPVRIGMDLAGQKPRTEDIVRADDERRLQAGDTILLTARATWRHGHRNEARCSIPDVLPQLRVGAAVTQGRAFQSGPSFNTSCTDIACGRPLDQGPTALRPLPVRPSAASATEPRSLRAGSIDSAVPCRKPLARPRPVPHG